MNEQEFQTKLAELMREISELPEADRAKLKQLADETRRRHEKLRQTIANLQESLDYLRLEHQVSRIRSRSHPARERISEKAAGAAGRSVRLIASFDLRFKKRSGTGTTSFQVGRLVFFPHILTTTFSLSPAEFHCAAYIACLVRANFDVIF